MAHQDFQTSTRKRDHDPRGSLADFFMHHRYRIFVCAAIVAALTGGALYQARFSESAPKVVYSASLEAVEAADEQPLLIDINTADAERLDELPQVGPSTAEAIIEYRQANGPFGTLEELEDVPGIGPSTLEEIKPFATV